MVFCKSDEGGFLVIQGKQVILVGWLAGNGKLEVKLVRAAGQVNGDTIAFSWN